MKLHLEIEKLIFAEDSFSSKTDIPNFVEALEPDHIQVMDKKFKDNETNETNETPKKVYI